MASSTPDAASDEQHADQNEIAELWEVEKVVKKRLVQGKVSDEILQVYF